MDIKKRIQELSLDQKAKLYFMGLVRQGKIDRLPEDPKAAYVSMMMDKDDYGRSISGKDKRTFMEPEDSMPAARARKLAGMEDDEMETRYDYDDPIFENYNKQSLLKALGSADDAIIQTHVSPDPLGRGYEKGAGPDGDFGYGDYRLDGQEYLIYNPNSNNKDSAAMWNSNDYVVALDKDGEEYEIAYSDIMRINSSINEGDTYEKMAAKGKKAGNLKQGTVRKRLRIKDGEKIPLARINKAISGLKKRKSLSDKDKKYLKALNLAKTLKTTTNIKEIATELGYLNEEVKTTLKDLTFNMVVNTFSDNYKDVQFTRKQPDGKDGPYYRDAVNFPNADDTSTKIGDMSAFKDWKDKTMKKFGNVSIKLDPKEDIWFNKVKIIDKKFSDAEAGFVKSKQDFIDKERELGRSID